MDKDASAAPKLGKIEGLRASGLMGFVPQHGPDLPGIPWENQIGHPAPLYETSISR
jgi:hypothetical protein